MNFRFRWYHCGSILKPINQTVAPKWCRNWLHFGASSLKWIQFAKTGFTASPVLKVQQYQTGFTMKPVWSKLAPWWSQTHYIYYINNIKLITHSLHNRCTGNQPTGGSKISLYQYSIYYYGFLYTLHWFSVLEGPGECDGRSEYMGLGLDYSM